MLNEEKSASGGEEQNNYDQTTSVPIQEQPVPIPPPPIIPTTPAQKRGFPKLLLLLGIVLIILILVLGGTGYFVLNQKKSAPAPSPMPKQQASTQTKKPAATPTPEPIVRKTFTSPKLANLSFSGYTLNHMSDWIEKVVKEDAAKTTTLTLSKNDYHLTISQGPFDGGACVYTDAEAKSNKGPTSNKRGKPAVDIIASFGSLRRDLEIDSQKKNTFAFCQKSDQDTSYGTLTKIGAIYYKTSAKTFDPLMLIEMDEIIESIKTL
jgi:hypothetical protein